MQGQARHGRALKGRPPESAAASTAQPATLSDAAPKPAPPLTEESLDSPDATAILAEKYGNVTRSHLNHLPALFRALTGLPCHVTWATTASHPWSKQDLPVYSALCRSLAARSPEALARCRKCAARHLALTLKAGHAGHGFTCFLGVHNFWQPVMVRQCVVGLACIQAPGLNRRGSPAAQEPSQTTPSSTPTAGARAIRHGGGGAKAMGPGEFHRTARLLQLIFEHAETLTLSDLRMADLAKTQQALHELQTVATHLREDLNGLMPALHKASPELEPLNHSERIARDMLRYIRERYAQPLTLKQCAKAMGLNTAYLSTLFSHRVGLPFKTYLTEVRIEKARELLGHSDLNIKQVAAAVGYASENRFRIAFKQATGLSPRVWRETLRVKLG